MLVPLTTVTRLVDAISPLLVMIIIDVLWTHAILPLGVPTIISFAMTTILVQLIHAVPHKDVYIHQEHAPIQSNAVLQHVMQQVAIA